MKKIESLPEITQSTMAGLTAGPDLKAKILLTAKEEKAPRFAFRRWAVPAACFALAAVVGLTFLARNPVSSPTMLRSTAAGSQMMDGRLQAELQPGSVVLTAGNPASSYDSIWAPLSGNYFPMICVNGAYYRLLRNPTSVTASLKGDAMGVIGEKTSDPVLCAAAVYSNTVSAGETVYALRNMQGAAVVANVNGVDRVFQRVSFNGNGTLGSEKLADTLKIAGHVTGMALTGVGTVTDGTALASLTDTLLSKAAYSGAGSSGDNASQMLLISLDNGITLQLAVKGGTLMACGSWSNPAFIEAFSAACK